MTDRVGGEHRNTSTRSAPTILFQNVYKVDCFDLTEAYPLDLFICFSSQTMPGPYVARSGPEVYRGSGGHGESSPPLYSCLSSDCCSFTVCLSLCSRSGQGKGCLLSGAQSWLEETDTGLQWNPGWLVLSY